MIVVEKLRLNRFRNVSLPSNKDLYLRVGARPVDNMADGQVANFDTSTMGNIDYLESQILKDNQMPLNESV